MQCEDVVDDLARAAEGYPIGDATSRSHVEHCLRCQAELVQYRKLLRALRAMRTEVLDPAPGLLTDVLASLEEAGERHAIRSMLTGRKAAYLGGIAAAATAAGAGALVLATRSRRSRLRVAS